MPFTRNHYYGTGSAKHSSFSYMTRALRALVCNCMTSCFAKPSSVIMISCKRYIAKSAAILHLEPFMAASPRCLPYTIAANFVRKLATMWDTVVGVWID